MHTRTVEIGGIRYTVREATRGELAQAFSTGNAFAAEDFLVRQCLIDPKIDPEEMYAGIPDKLAREITELSGANEADATRLQQQADEWAISPVGKLDALIMGVLHLTPKDIDAMYSEEWHKAAAAAQLLAASLYGLDLRAYMNIGEQQANQVPQQPQQPPPRIQQRQPQAAPINQVQYQRQSFSATSSGKQTQRRPTLRNRPPVAH